MTGPDALGLGDSWPRPGWAVLDAAREQAFTGIVELHTSPAVRVCFDRGRVYLAERVTDPPIGARLVDAGAVTAAELERGTIRVGETDHLGRLFDRVPGVDRFRVLVLVEMMTDEATSWVAAQTVRGADVRPYDHHASGIHHWDRERDRTVVLLEGTSRQFAPPVPGTAVLTADLVADVVERPVGDVDALTDEVRIEWADAAWLGSALAPAVASATASAPPRPDAALPLDPPLAPPPFAGGPTDLTIDLPIDADSAAVALVAADDVVDGFEVIWPTGEVQRELSVPLDPLDRGPGHGAGGVVVGDEVPPAPGLVWNLRMPAPTLESGQTDADLVDELAEEVAQAVRRAIAAITAGDPDVDVDEVLGFEPVATAPEPDDGPLIVRASTLTPAETEAAQRLSTPAVVPVTPPPPAAPAESVPVDAAPIDVAPAPTADRSDERVGALRRLIGSLRRR